MAWPPVPTWTHDPEEFSPGGRFSMLFARRYGFGSEPRAPVRCWWCGEDEVYTERIGAAEYVYPLRLEHFWSSDPRDHEHAERPPTPAELADAGHAALMRILGNLCRDDAPAPSQSSDGEYAIREGLIWAAIGAFSLVGMWFLWLLIDLYP